jgi:hypothetical protein
MSIVDNIGPRRREWEELESMLEGMKNNFAATKARTEKNINKATEEWKSTQLGNGKYLFKASNLVTINSWS